MTVFALWLFDGRDYYSHTQSLLGLFDGRMKAMLFLREDQKTREPHPHLHQRAGRCDCCWYYEIEEVTDQ